MAKIMKVLFYTSQMLVDWMDQIALIKQSWGICESQKKYLDYYRHSSYTDMEKDEEDV